MTCKSDIRSPSGSNSSKRSFVMLYGKLATTLIFRLRSPPLPPLPASPLLAVAVFLDHASDVEFWRGGVVAALAVEVDVSGSVAADVGPVASSAAPTYVSDCGCARGGSACRSCISIPRMASSRPTCTTQGGRMKDKE
ncbi:hypothetical protein Vafri_8613 [Volvox africanus]|uniref:Uncharacterized protein n=1 Tax=Volvox africanus TaxID=51714 RepID=A0A8J4B3A6_9CHLO|nr:hypothetical protein Vafri_8613 [Volvox africanus]